MLGVQSLIKLVVERVNCLDVISIYFFQYIKVNFTSIKNLVTSMVLNQYKLIYLTKWITINEVELRF